MVPVLAINIVLGGALPAPFQSEIFWHDTPWVLGLLETVSRMAVTSLPVLMAIRWNEGGARPGLALYGVGLLAYATAWVALILAPSSGWSTSLVGFSAPAWLPALWLGGIYFASAPYWRWAHIAFALASAAFIVSHLAHTILVFSRLT